MNHDLGQCQARIGEWSVVRHILQLSTRSDLLDGIFRELLRSVTLGSDKTFAAF